MIQEEAAEEEEVDEVEVDQEAEVAEEAEEVEEASEVVEEALAVAEVVVVVVEDLEEEVVALEVEVDDMTIRKKHLYYLIHIVLT